jgi:hypothetical protein
MTFKGKVIGGVVVLDELDALPEGAVVKVEMEKTARKRRAKRKRTLGERLRAWGGFAKGMPSDMARNHDHYLYGVPKK